MKRGAPVMLALVAFFGFLCLGSGSQDAPQPPAAVPRFQEVAPGFCRGGLPTPAGLRFLKQKGIRTIVDLRPEDGERALVEELGMQYVKLPISAWDRIPEETIQTFFRIVRDPAHQPVFIHCRRGADRVGVMVGFYRIAFQGWDGERAYREARALGMRWWYRGLKRQLDEFAAKQAAARGTPPRHQPVAR
jgi:protein tyrosine/serine phosphatase